MASSQMVSLMVSFTKMHGLGNDFIVIDQRQQSLSLSDKVIALLADRRLGIGCDQFIILEASDVADAFMRIFNADGSEVGACGNATRCVGRLLLDERDKESVSIQTIAGQLSASRASGEQITAILPPPIFDWQQIPLAQAVSDIDALPIALEELESPSAVSVGNPHMVFFVDDVDAIPLAEIGNELEYNPLFPERTNVEVVEVLAPDHLKMRVWERGAGITQACGTGACASLIAAVKRGLAARKATVSMPGGALEIAWRDEKSGNHVEMTGDAVISYRGTFDLEHYLA